MNNNQQKLNSTNSLPLGEGRGGAFGALYLHHLKIAFRNLRKYKTQNIISIIGLAIGFTCFAFSALWIRYEMSYDNFHPKADRIYRVHIDNKWSTVDNASKVSDPNPYPLGNYLKSTFPEIEDACGIRLVSRDDYSLLYIDSSFCNIFDVKIPKDLFVRGLADQPVVVTNNLIGATEFLKEKYKYDVHTTIPRWSANTNIPFDIVVPMTNTHFKDLINNWNTGWCHTYILVKNGINIKTLREKLDKFHLPERLLADSPPVSLVLTPITQLRYKDPSGNIQSDIKFAHIQIFAISGLLVILCSLFNHLTLYVTRVRMRLRELALRKVNGATNWQIAGMLYSDFLLIIILSLVLGFVLMAWLLPTFKEYAAIGNSNITIFSELLLYAALLISCGFVVGGIPILFFHKQVLDECIKGSGSPGSRNLFRKVSLLVQLIISLGLMFCSIVFIKQIRFLHHTDLGINRHNIAAVHSMYLFDQLTPPYANRIKQIPGITDAIPITQFGFNKDGMTGGSSSGSFEKDGKQVNYTIWNIQADERFFDFFGMEIIEGKGFSNGTFFTYRVVNETALKELGDYVRNDRLLGVVRDFYFTPTTKPKPIEFYYPDPRSYAKFIAIAYKYEEGFRQQTQQAVTKLLYKEFPHYGEFEIVFTYLEDIFEEHFKSERALLTLLSVITLACILIAVFGVYSLTSLTCQQRRKEIAIRKVYGAEVLDIMNIFFVEYLILLGLAALVAFPAGYLIMKRWLEGYVKQTSMDAWLFVAIFLVVFVVIVFSIFTMVWRAANRNPAEGVKSE